MHIIGPERWWAGGSVGLSLPTLREVGSTVCGTPRGGGSTMGPIQLGAEGSLGLAGEARPKEGGRKGGSSGVVAARRVPLLHYSYYYCV